MRKGICYLGFSSAWALNCMVFPTPCLSGRLSLWYSRLYSTQKHCLLVLLSFLLSWDSDFPVNWHSFYLSCGLSAHPRRTCMLDHLLPTAPGLSGHFQGGPRGPTDELLQKLCPNARFRRCRARCKWCTGPRRSAAVCRVVRSSSWGGLGPKKTGSFIFSFSELT